MNLKDFEPNLLKIDKKHYKGINTCYIGYIMIKKIDDYESIYSVNLLYLQLIMQMDILRKKIGNQYLVFNSKKKMQMFGTELKIKSKQ